MQTHKFIKFNENELFVLLQLQFVLCSEKMKYREEKLNYFVIMIKGVEAIELLTGSLQSGKLSLIFNSKCTESDVGICYIPIFYSFNFMDTRLIHVQTYPHPLKNEGKLPKKCSYRIFYIFLFVSVQFKYSGKTYREGGMSHAVITR